MAIRNTVPIEVACIKERAYMKSTDLGEAADRDSASNDRPRPRCANHSDNSTARHGATVRVAHRHKPVNGDVHQSVDRRDDEQWSHEAGGETQRPVEYILGAHRCRQRERHGEHAAEEVRDGQTTEEHVSAGPHAPVAHDNEDDQRVTDDGDDHDAE